MEHSNKVKIPNFFFNPIPHLITGPHTQRERERERERATFSVTNHCIERMRGSDGSLVDEWL
jgi:hypothetical protein